MVTSVLRHLRPLLISVVALVLTAGIAFAAKPSTPPGLAVGAAQASGKTVPIVTESDENTQADQDTDSGQGTGNNPGAETSQGAEAPADSADAGDHCATDPRTTTPEQLAAMNHGAIVCWAAHQATPDGFANHGAWVSSWAKQDHGADASAKGKAHKP